MFLFHDESIFHSNDDQNLKWGVKGENIMKGKSKGAGIMVSDFIYENNGFLALSETEYEEAKKSNPSLTLENAKIKRDTGTFYVANKKSC